VTAHFEYDPFGNTVVNTDSSNQFAYRFSTKPLDFATGLYYYSYRYYDPGTGRWLSKDPIGEKGGSNLYGFSFNGSTNVIDILGLDGAPADWEIPHERIPMGPWEFSRDDQNRRGGTYRPKYPIPGQSKPTLTHSPETCNTYEYWKLNDGKGGTQRYSASSGLPIPKSLTFIRPSWANAQPTRPVIESNYISRGNQAAGGAAAALILLQQSAEIFDNYLENSRYEDAISSALADCASMKSKTPNAPGSCCGCCTITTYYRWEFPQIRTFWNTIGWPGTQNDFIPASGRQSFVQASGFYTPSRCDSLPKTGGRFFPIGIGPDTHAVYDTSFAY